MQFVITLTTWLISYSWSQEYKVSMSTLVSVVTALRLGGHSVPFQMNKEPLPHWLYVSPACQSVLPPPDFLLCSWEPRQKDTEVFLVFYGSGCIFWWGRRRGFISIHISQTLNGLQALQKESSFLWLVSSSLYSSVAPCQKKLLLVCAPNNEEQG